MARGKKLDNETVYKIMTSYAVTNNFTETSRNLGVPVTTVEQTVKRNKDKPEFVELRNEKQAEFADKASEIIDMGLKLLHRRLSTALDHEEKLDELLMEVSLMPKEEMSDKQKQALYNKINSLQLQRLGEITTAVGTLYDKRALAKGDSTENSTITVKMGEEMKSWAK